MNISSFDQLLRAARQQPEPQRLLFVFARAELPEDATPADIERFKAGRGGALAPVMFVDKRCDEIDSLAQLVAESRHTGQAWDLVFAGCLGGLGGREPGDDETQAALELMVKSIQGGSVSHLLAYRENGEQLSFAAN